MVERDLSSLSMAQLIQNATFEKREQFDDFLSLEITDRIKVNKEEAKICCTELLKVFKQKNLQRLKWSVELLDIISKNGTEFFLMIIARTELFHEEFLLILKSKRGKTGLKDKVLSKQKKQTLDEVQEKLLALIQLWADTFIMHEDKFPLFQKTYRLLRKEGVKFP